MAMVLWCSVLRQPFVTCSDILYYAIKPETSEDIMRAYWVNAFVTCVIYHVFTVTRRVRGVPGSLETHRKG